jgi:hypothetical protein
MTREGEIEEHDEERVEAATNDDESTSKRNHS